MANTSIGKPVPLNVVIGIGGNSSLLANRFARFLPSESRNFLIYALNLMSIEFLNGLCCSLFISELHEGKPSRTTCVSIRRHRYVDHYSNFRKDTFKLSWCGFIAHVPNKNLIANDDLLSILVRKPPLPAVATFCVVQGIYRGLYNKSARTYVQFLSLRDATRGRQDLIRCLPLDLPSLWIYRLFDDPMAL